MIDTSKTQTKERFFKLIVFNYILSNGDAHLKNFSLIRNEKGEYQLSPAYDLMSTVIHSPNESDTAFSLYEGDMNSEFYQRYGFYGKPDFIELAKRLNIVEKRAVRILSEFVNTNDTVIELIQQSLLVEVVKQKYIANYMDKLNRFGTKIVT